MHFLNLFATIYVYLISLLIVAYLSCYGKTNLVFIRINLLQNSSSQQELPTVSKKEVSSQRNQSSLVLATSGTQISSSLDDLIRNTIKEEVGKLTSDMKDPIQQAVYQCFERRISNEKPEHEEGSVSKEEVGSKSSDTNLHREELCHKESTQKPSSERTKIINSSTLRRTLFGTIVFISKVYEERGVPCYENLFMFHPADWLIWLGVRSSLDILITKSIRGWKNNLDSRTFRAVSDNASIFQLCKNGDVGGIKTLFANGDASVLDRNSGGLTLLHVSIILLVMICRHQQRFFRAECRSLFKTFKNLNEHPHKTILSSSRLLSDLAIFIHFHR